MNATTKLMIASVKQKIHSLQQGLHHELSPDGPTLENKELTREIDTYSTVLTVLRNAGNRSCDQFIQNLEETIGVTQGLRKLLATMSPNEPDYFLPSKQLIAAIESLGNASSEFIEQGRQILPVLKELQKEKKTAFPDLTELDTLQLHELFQSQPQIEGYNFVSISPDLRSIVSDGRDKELHRYDAETGTPLEPLTFDGPLMAGAFLRDGRLVIAEHLGKTTPSLNLVTPNKATKRVDVELGSHDYLKLAVFGNELGAIGFDQHVHTFTIKDLEKGSSPIPLQHSFDLTEGKPFDRTSTVFSLEFSPDGNELVVGSGYFVLRFINLQSGDTRLKTEKRGETGVGHTYLAFTPERLLAGGWWGTEFIDPKTGEVYFDQDLKSPGTRGTALYNVAVPGNGHLRGSKIVWGDQMMGRFHVGVLRSGS